MGEAESGGHSGAPGPYVHLCIINGAGGQGQISWQFTPSFHTAWPAPLLPLQFTHLHTVQPAPLLPLQFTAVSALVRELQGGMDMVKEELLQLQEGERERLGQPPSEVGAAAASVEGAASSAEEPFVVRVGAFVAQYASECAGLLDVEAGCIAVLRRLCEGYFGEAFDGRDPTRTLVIVKEFLEAFAKAVAAIQGAAGKEPKKQRGDC